MGSVGLVGTLVGLFLIVAYFAPTIIAALRKHADALAIGALNFLLGWSVVGWIVALIWSLSDPRGRGAGQTVVVNTTQNLGAPYSSPYPVDPRPPVPPAIDPRPAQPALAASHPTPAITADDADTSFWDRIPNKNDPDDLEEYLIRFPGGRFAGLAEARLRRAGVRPPGDVQAAPLSTLQLSAPVAARTRVETCGACGEAWEDGAQFCSGCGVRRTRGALA